MDSFLSTNKSGGDIYSSSCPQDTRCKREKSEKSERDV